MDEIMANEADIKIAVLEEKLKTFDNLEMRLYKHIDDKFAAMQKIIVLVLLLGLGGNSELASHIIKSYLGVTSGIIKDNKHSQHAAIDD